MKKYLLKFVGIVSIIGIFASMGISLAIAATIPTSVALFETTLASSITSSATSFTLVSATTKDGTTLSGNYAFIIDEGTATEEMVSASCTATACTSAVRGLSVVTGNTSVAALKKDHRRGASVKITDGPQLLILSRINNGQETFPNAISYASGIGPISGSDIADKEYVLSVVSGGSITYDKLVVSGTAATTLAAGNLVYLNGSGKWDLADADSASTSENILLGISQGAGTVNNPITGGVLIRGVDSNQSGAAAGNTGYVSSTAGAISTSAATSPAKTKVIGTFKSATEIYFDPNFFYGLTNDMKAALAGSQGVPSSTNKYVTQDNLSSATTDQSQLTQNGTTETGEANATTKKNKLAQSFISTKTKIRGVNLYKSADTGTFTGTVTISIQADSASAPSGSALATKTFTNIEWGSKSVGAFETIFTSEYASLTVGSTYWIVIETSTSDNSNHPNIGTNTAGGYGSGSVKYNNTTDGWTAISTIDLYFSTLEGTASQALVTDSSGKIASSFYDLSKMPKLAFYQMVPFSSDSTANSMTAIASDNDGSAFFVRFDGSTDTLKRFARDSITGTYKVTHTESTLGFSGNAGMVVVGDYLYVAQDTGATSTIYRYAKADLSGKTTMTGISIGATGSYINMFTDGTFIYLQENSTSTFYKLSISGSVLTNVGTVTAASGVYGAYNTYMYDGTNQYAVVDSSANINTYKFSARDGSSAGAANNIWNSYALGSNSFGAGGSQYYVGMVNIDTTRAYLVYHVRTYQESTNIYTGIYMMPVTKP